jgi:hypothetical protein
VMFTTWTLAIAPTRANAQALASGQPSVRAASAAYAELARP